MTLLEQFTLSSDPTFRSRVMMALILAATQVQAEDSGTANHALRSAEAFRVLHDPTGETLNYVVGVVTNPSITGKATDNDIEFTVNSLFNAYSLGAPA